MINRFDADNFAYQGRGMCVDMLDELQFGLGRSNHQNLLRSLQFFHDGMVIVLIFRRPSTAQRANAGMQFVMGLAWLNNRILYIVWTNVHHMGFRVIDPN